MELPELQAKIADLEQQIAELPAGSVHKKDDQRQCVFLSPLDREQETPGEVYSCRRGGFFSEAD